MTTKMKLIIFYAERNKIKDFKTAEEKLDRFIESLIKALSENEKVMFRRFGSFEVRKTTEREITDPRGRQEKIHAKPRKYVKFTVSKVIENSLCLGETKRK